MKRTRAHKTKKKVRRDTAHGYRSEGVVDKRKAEDKVFKETKI